MRTSPIHYIAPSSIEITPNANNSYNDLAVYIAPVTDIKVYCPRLGIGTANGTYCVWQLYGRNRRLNDSRDGYSHTKAYTIYARLSKADSEDGYIVFTPKQQYDNEWYDKYSYITKDGLSIRYNAGADSEPRIFDDANYWYVKLGEVSAADSTNQRTVDLDTGILGTDQWNSEWALNPDALPLRIDMEYRLRNVADEEWDEWTAITRYVRWNQVLHVKAQLVEGWTGTDINRFHHWEITRDTGNADADSTWNDAHDGRDGDSGDYTETEFDLNLVHLRGTGDDFNSVLQALFTLTAYELNPDYTAGSEEPQYLPLISSSFSVIAETVETFDLEESSSTVTYNPQTGVYVPAIAYNEQTHQYSADSGVTIRVRATDADGKTFYPTTEQIQTIGMHVYCRPIDDNTTPVEVTLTNGRGTLPSAPFLAGKSVEVWLQVGAWDSRPSANNIILSQKTITYIRFGAKGDTPINCYRWYKEGLTPVKPTATNSDEPAPASGDATGASNVYPTDKWSGTIPDRPSTGEWLLWVCSSIRHGDNTRDAWSGPVQMSGTKGEPGEDATDREYIYKRLNTYPFSGTSPASITTDTSGTQRTAEYIATHDDFVPQGWSDTAMPATSSEKYVYMSVRIKEPGQRWGAFSAPVLWTNWGVQGTDGDGVQYLYKLFSEELDESGRMSQRPSGATFNETTKEWECTGWSDDPLAPTSSSPFCYCAIIKKINGSWNEDLQHHGVFEKLGLWSKWAEDGDSITKDSETPYYIKNTTGVRPAEDDPAWSTTKPTLNKGEWLFTKIDIEWSDGSHTILYTDERNPNDGQAGQDIIVDGATVMKYYVGDSNTTHPADGSSDWKDLSQVTQEQGKWLWSQATTYYRKADSTAGSHDAGTSINYNVSYIAEDGKTGRGIQSITEYYQATNSSAARQAPSSETGWDTDPNLSHLTDKWDQSHKYLWNMEKTVYSNVDGSTTTEYSVPQILAIWTKDGAAGKGVDSIQNYYKITNTTTPPSRPSTDPTGSGNVDGWYAVPQAPTAENPYLWNYEKVTWVNPSDTTYTDPQMIGHFGKDGDNGGNTATVMLYKRSSDAVTSVGINTTLYYKFSTPNKLYTNAACTTEATSSNLNDWSLTIPNDSTDPIYVTAATTYSNTESDDITSNEWVTPAKYTENGAQGAHGVNTATIFLYKRSQNAISSHGITAALYYKFSDGKLYKKSGNTYTEASDSDRSNWLLNIPASDGNPCYVIQAAALSTEDYDQIATTDWSGVRKLVEDGKSITKDGADTYRYAIGDSGINPPASGWNTAKPSTFDKDKWLWTETTIHWSDNSDTVLYSAERNPTDGAAGQDIIVDGATVMKYYVGTSNTTHPADGSSDWKDLSQVTQEQGKWLWSQATTYYRKASSTAGSHDAGTSINYNVSYIAEDGKTGRGIQSITEYYQATNSSEARQAPSSETGWDSDPNLSHLTDKWNQSHKYLWNMEKTVYSNVDGSETTEYSIPQILAIWTKDGDAGRGIDSIQNYYKVQATEPSLPDDIDTDNPTLTGWSTSPSNPPAGQHLWNFERITWIESDDTNSYTHTAVHSAGYTGTNGENAIRLDLDNEHEDMLYSDSQTLPIAPSGGATSAIHLYDGSTEMTSGFTLEVDFAKSSGVPGISAANHPTISNGVLTVPHITANTAKVVVKAIYNSKEYFAEFTANKTMQDKYDLQLTPNSIPYNPATYPDGGVTIMPSVRRTDFQGNVTSVNISTTESEGNVCLYWALVNNDGTHGNLSLLTTASCPASGSTMAASGVYFELRKLTAYVNGVWQYRMCDYDTVPFTKAENGTPADVWTIDSEGWWCKNGVRTTTKAEGKDGTGVEIKGGVDSYYTAAGKTSLQSLDLTNVLYGDCYIVNDDSDATHGGHLYFFLALTSPANWYDNWRDLGKIKGEPGTNGTTYYVHYAYADTINLTTTPISGTGFALDSNGNKAWMGIVVDTNQYDPGSSQRPATDPSNPYAEYEWNKVKGTKGDPGADAVEYKIEFTDKTFALDPNTNKSVISIKGVVRRTEGNSTTQVNLTGQDLAMRFVKNDGTTQELSLGGDFGIQNNEFVTYAGNGSVNTNFKTFIVEFKPTGAILAQDSLALTVYGEKGMEAIRGYADYLYSVDDQGQSKPAPTVDELGNIDLLRYSGNQNRIEICELVSGSYVWKGYGKTDYPDGTMFVCKIDNHIYRASASGWVDEGRFKGDNAVVYKIDFTDSTFAYDPNNHWNVVDVKGIVYKIDGGNTSVFTSLGTGSSLELYFLHEGRAYDYDPVTSYTVSNGSFSTTQRNGAETRGEKGILAIVKIGGNEVARANIAISQYAEDGSRGKRGRSYYYAQPWENTSDVYLVNDSVAPYFLYNDNYYVYNPVDDIDGPVAMSAMGVPGSNDNWERMTNEFKYIITEAIFGKYADFGSFRINGDWLYSELGEFVEGYTEDHPNFLHKLYDFRKSYPDDVTEVNLPACNYIHPEDPNITYVEIYDDSEESGSTIPTVTTKTNILTDDDDAWLNLKSGVIYSFSAYFANCKFYLRKNRVKRASIVLYKRSSTTISAHGITTTLYYKFSDGKLYTKSGNVYTEATDADLNNWKLEKPADNGNTCYFIQAAALGAGDYDQIQTTEWSEANMLHTGDQVDVRYVRLYKRSSSAVTTVGINTALYYNFSDGKLYTKSGNTYTEATSSDLNGWSLKAPTGSTDQLYLTAAIANRYTERDKITSTEWVTPTPLTVDDLTLMYSSSSPTTQLVYFELAEDGEYQFIVEKYVQSQSGSAYLNWVIIREHYFLAYIAINGRNGYILQRNSHGHYNGTGNFTEVGIGSANIGKMHSGGAYSEGTWIDIENGTLDVSRYSKVRVVEWSSNPSATGVNVLGYLYVDSDKTIKFSESARSFYNLTSN